MPIASASGINGGFIDDRHTNLRCRKLMIADAEERYHDAAEPIQLLFAIIVIFRPFDAAFAKCVGAGSKDKKYCHGQR